MKPKKPAKFKRWKKRFIFIGVLVVVLILASLWYIEAVGDDYDLHTSVYFNDRTLQNIQMQCSKDDRVVMTDYYLTDDGEAVVSLTSDEHGETDATFTFQTEYGVEPAVLKTHFTVNEMDTIIENRDGIINFNGYLQLFYFFLGLMAAVMIVAICSFIGCLRKIDYSYAMIGYGGVALYIFGVLAFLIYKLLNNAMSTFSAMIFSIGVSGSYLLILLLPIMLFLAIAVTVSNIWLILHEGNRPLNALGIIFSFVWMIGMVLVMDVHLSGEMNPNSITLFYQIQSVLTYILIYFECMLISTSVSAFLASRHTPPLDRDYIIILGCSIRKDGSLTPLLKGRVDSALNFEKCQYQKNGKHACFVPSGGQGADECISEGEAMERYLTEQGVPSEQILREDKSVNTFENMKFSKEVIEKTDPDFEKKKIAFATTNYHVFRGYILSNKNGFEAQGISAKTKWYFFPNAFLREFIGLLYSKLFHHILYIACLILAVFVIEYII